MKYLFQFLDLISKTMASFTERYHEFTKYNPHTIDRLGEVKWSEQPRQFKELIEDNSIPLVNALQFLRKDNQDIQWHSLANTDDGLSLNYLARLLYFTCGISSLYETPQQVFYFRCNPSAGGLYPIELYFATPSSHPMGEGLWYFHPLQMAIGKCQTEVDNVYNKLLESTYIGGEKKPEVLLLYSGKFSRGEWRYKQRTYRRMLLDLGHALENTTLFCEFSHRQINTYPSFADQQIIDLDFLDADEVPLMIAGLNLSENPHTAEIAETVSPKDSFKRIADSKETMMYKQNQVEFLDNNFGQGVTLTNHSKLPFEYHRFIENIPRSIRTRRSCREFSGTPISLEWLERTLKLAFLHHDTLLTQGALKFSLAVQRLDDLPQGTYDLTNDGEIIKNAPRALNREMMTEACLSQEISLTASVVIIAHADLNEATARWGDRVYRHLCTDAGRIGQRLNLLATNSPMGMSGVGGYYDDLINETLGLTNNQAILYVMTLGMAR